MGPPLKAFPSIWFHLCTSEHHWCIVCVIVAKDCKIVFFELHSRICLIAGFHSAFTSCLDYTITNTAVTTTAKHIHIKIIYQMCKKMLEDAILPPVITRFLPQEIHTHTRWPWISSSSGWASSGRSLLSLFQLHGSTRFHVHRWNRNHDSRNW